jgi:hypothetical protein
MSPRALKVAELVKTPFRVHALLANYILTRHGQSLHRGRDDESTDGAKSPPNAATAVIAAVLAILGGLLWTAHPAPDAFDVRRFSDALAPAPAEKWPDVGPA